LYTKNERYFVNIAFSLDIGVSQAKTFVCRHEFTKDLPPKTIVKKRITDGRMCLEIKRICWENPRSPIRKYPQILMSLFEESKPIPKWPTIENDFSKMTKNTKFFLKKFSLDQLICERD
jgi:hypothetical protein